MQKDLDLTSTFFLVSCPCSLPGTQAQCLEIRQSCYEQEDKVHTLRIKKQSVDEALILADTRMQVQLFGIIYLWISVTTKKPDLGIEIFVACSQTLF